MSKSITITPYALRIIDTSNGSSRRLDDLPGGTNLIEFLTAYCELRSRIRSVNNTTEHALKVMTHQVTAPHLIDGIVQGGAFGFAADIEHLNTGNRFRRTIDDCEFLPFFFSVLTHPGQNEALLLLQRFGIFGAKSILQDDLSCYVERNLHDSKLAVNPIVSDEYIEEIIGGQIKSLSCLRYNVPADVADDLGLEDHQEDSAIMEMKIKAKRDRFLGVPGWMRDIVNGWSEHSGMIEISGIEYHDVRLHVDIGGNRTRTIRLSDLRKVRMNIDVTEDVVIGNDGHPTLDSMRHVVEGLSGDFSAAIGWRNDLED